MSEKNVEKNHESLVEELLRRNEFKSNRLMMLFLGLLWVILFLILILTYLEVFWLEYDLYFSFFAAATFFLIPLFILYKKNWQKTWFKYVVLMFIMCIIGGIDSYLGYNLKLILVVPTLVSIRYFSKYVTLTVAIASFVMMFFSSMLNAQIGELDLNMLDIKKDLVVKAREDIRTIIIETDAADREGLIKTQFIFGFIPESFVLLLISVVGYKVAGRGRQMILEQADISLKTSRLETELNLASSIQNGMLPSIFPPFPERHEFDIYASMTPAKEVGGDFYDFFMVDDDHLALVMADVSGKGVPAALFMMIAKTLLKTQAQNGGSPAEILQKVNNQLCSNNPGEMFVTVWLGIYEISTGKLIAANAGHEYPAIKKANGAFELFKDKHGFVLAGMEGTRYKEYELQLDVGDSLFVYTDGVAEATNATLEQFGTERMLFALNAKQDVSAMDLLSTVHSKVDEFVGNAEQFDDMTMLSVTRKV